MPASSFFSQPQNAGGVTYSVPNAPSFLQSQGGAIAGAAKALIARAMYNPDNDPKVAEAAYYRAQANKANVEAGQTTQADSVVTEQAQKMIQRLQAGAELAQKGLGGPDPAAVQDFIANTAPYVKDWDHYKGLISQVWANMPAGMADNPIVKNALVMSLGGIDKNHDINATDHAARVTEDQSIERDKIDEHLQASKYAADSSAATARADTGARVAEDARAHNMEDVSKRRGQDLEHQDRQGKDAGTTTTAKTEDIVTPADPGYGIGPFTFGAKPAQVTKSKVTRSTVTKSPIAAAAAQVAAPGSAPPAGGKAAPGTRPPLSAFQR